MNLKNVKEQLPGQVKIGDEAQATIIVELNSLLAEEFQAWYQYFIVAPFLVGDMRPEIQEFFIKTADDELNDHAQLLINRINELNGECLLKTPESWKQFAYADFLLAGLDVNSQLAINGEAEIKAIQHYQQVIELAESLKDYTTRDILKKILADEEQHLSEINDFIKDIHSKL